MGDALTTESVLVCSVGTVTSFELAVVVPPNGAGLVPVVLDVSLIEPLLMSAWVTVYTPLKWATWLGSSVVLDVDVHELADGFVNVLQVGPEVRAPAGEIGRSVTPTLVRVTLPVLVTT